MSPWIYFEALLPVYGALDLFRRDGPLFNEPMRDNCRHCSVEKIQDPVLNTLKAHPEFVYPLAQKVSFGSPQFVANFTQPLQSQETLVLHLCGLFVKPLQEWAGAVLFPVKDDSRSGHLISVYSQNCESANGETERDSSTAPRQF